MKKILALGLLLAGTSAVASTARMEALQSPIHIQDVVSVYTRPSDLMLVPEMMTFDLGMAGAAPAVGNDARGGMIKGIGEGRLGFFVGVVDAARSSTFLGIENPFSVAYGSKVGDINWAVLFTMATSDKKTIDKKASYMNLTGSAVLGDLTFGADLGLGNTATGITGNADAKYSNSPMAAFGQYAMGDWTLHGKYEMSTNKDDSSGAEIKTDDSTITVGGLNSMKKEGSDFFYGVSVVMDTHKVGTTKTEETTLPVLVGIEADAASWLTLRGSISQNVLFGTTKTTETDSVAHNTKVAAGAGFKFNKAVLDVTLQAAGTGNLDSNLGAKAGLTYLF